MTLPTAETRLHSALSEYLRIVREGGAALKQAVWTEKLKSSLHTLETLQLQLAPQLDLRLRHFMESKSYRKAHEHLDALLSSKLANPVETRQSCVK